MQDRLGELSRAGASSSVRDPEMGGGDEKSQFMSDFFREVGTIKSIMNDIKNNVKIIEQKHGQTLTDVYGGKQFKAELDDYTDATNAKAGQVKTMLKNMDAANEEFKQQNPNSSEARIRQNMHQQLTKKFMEHMSEYQEVQTKYKNKYRETVERQYKIVKPDATQEDVEKVLDGGSDTIFTDHMLIGSGAQAAKNALADIQERHHDIQRLERSINELYELFSDLALLVDAQGELLDQIEYSVGQALDFTKTGVQELNKANEYAKKSRKKMCCIAVTLIIIIVVVIGPIVSKAMKGS